MISHIVAHRAGRRRQRREDERATREALERDADICDNCGYRRVQHHDDGRCPQY